MPRLCLALGLVACAHPVTQPPSPPLVGELARLAWYVGDWRCEGQEAGSPERWKATVQVRGDAGGGVVAIHMRGPGDNATSELKGYDPVAKRWYHVWTARDGSHGSFSAAAWDGDLLITIDDADPKRRTVMTRLGPDRYAHREEQDAGQGFAMTWEKVCTRAR